MHELLTSSTYFNVTLTLVAFGIGSLCSKKLKLSFLNPIVVASVLVILTLRLLNIPNETYQAGCTVLNFLLTPATLCLAISFYEQLGKLKHHLLAISLGVLAGTVCSLGSVYLLAKAFSLDETMLYSLLPKSITTAIGAALSEEIGGIAAITTAVIILTGILGNIIGPGLCKLLRLRHPIAQGVAFGTASHVVGTTKAMEMSELAGAVSSLSLTIAGLLTAVLMSFLVQFL